MLFFPSANFAKSGVQPITTGWRLPGSANQSGSAPQVPWSSVNNILATGGAFALAQLDYPFKTTQVLRAFNFNFAAESIPSGATITGFEIEVARNILINSGAPVISDASLYWVDNYSSPSVSGVSLASSAAWPETTSPGDPGTAVIYSSTVPSQGALTKAILEGANFAVILAVKHSPDYDGDAYARVDSIRTRATYVP